MDLVDHFASHLSSTHTQRAYRTDLRAYFGRDTDVTPNDVVSTTTQAIKSHVRTLQKRKLSESAQRRRIAALRSFFDWVVEQEMREFNPAREGSIDIVDGGSHASASPFLTADEVETLIRTAGQPAATGLRDQALLLTIFYGALRRGEAASLTVEQVRPLGRHWIIDLETDGGGGGGYIRVPSFVVHAIDRMQEAHNIDTGPLWRSLSNRNRGQPLSADALYKVVRRTAERADIDSVTIDVLRRTGLHLALKGGAPLGSVHAHARFREPATAATLQDVSEPAGYLTESLDDYVELDVSNVLVEG